MCRFPPYPLNVHLSYVLLLLFTYSKYVDTVFGSKEVLRMYEQRKKTRSNAFTHFSSSLSLMPTDASILWRGLSNVRKVKIKTLAQIRKSEYEAFMTLLDTKVSDYNFKGPLGPRSKNFRLTLRSSTRN